MIPVSLRIENSTIDTLYELLFLLTINYPSFKLDKDKKPLICIVLHNYSKKHGYNIEGDPKFDDVEKSDVTFDHMVERI